MNETQVRTLELVRRVVAGTEALEFRRCEDDQGRYAWIESVLRRFDYRQLPRQDRGLVLAYLQRLSGYSRAQHTRLVSRWITGKCGRLSIDALLSPHKRQRAIGNGQLKMLGHLVAVNHLAYSHPNLVFAHQLARFPIIKP